MKHFAISLLACLVACAVVAPDAPARGSSAKAAASPAATPAPAGATAPSQASASSRVRAPRGSSRNNDSRGKDRKPATPATRIVLQKISGRAIAAERKAAEREQAERGARADRLYAASQLSAPIILDPKACRRTGANGESIYENC